MEGGDRVSTSSSNGKMEGGDRVSGLVVNTLAWRNIILDLDLFFFFSHHRRANNIALCSNILLYCI